MGIAVGDVDLSCPTRSGNSQGSEAHVDQQTDVAVPQIVYANPFHPSLLTATVHFSVKIAFADGEHPAVRLHSIELLEVSPAVHHTGTGGIWITRLLLGVLGVVTTSCLLSRW